MEGKELSNNDDEELDPKSKKIEENADDFGLPEIENSEDDNTDLAEPNAEIWEDNKEEETIDDSDASTEDSLADETIDSAYNVDDDTVDSDSNDDGYQSSYYEEEYEKKKSPVGWIILGVVILIFLIIGILMWVNKDDAPESTATRKPAPVVVQPVQEPEPEVVVQEPEPEPVAETQTGVFDLGAPNGRYHVIVASSIDSDLVRDYAYKLAAQGMTCNILTPLGNKKFHRLSVADYVSLNDASIRSEQLKNEIGPDVWVIRY